VLCQGLEDVLWSSVVEVIEQNCAISNPFVSKLKNVSLSLGSAIA
jgi:hypothetical protein